MVLPVCDVIKDQSNSRMGILLLYGAPALLPLQEVNYRPIEIDPRNIYYIYIKTCGILTVYLLLCKILFFCF